MTRVPAKRRSATLRLYYRKRARFFAAGLTCKGTPRKRIFKKYFTAFTKRAAQRRWSYAQYLRRRARNLAAGLTERGTPRKYRTFPELRGLRRPEYDRVKYHLLNSRAKRVALTSLVQKFHVGEISLLSRFK